MFIKLFLLFTIVPLTELALLIKVGGVFGVFHTVALVVFTGVLGAYLARSQGLRVLKEFNESINRNDVPTDPLIEGLLVLIAAVLLVTPGILTDIVGFSLIAPGIRKLAREYIKRKIQARPATAPGQTGASWFFYSQSGAPRRQKKDTLPDSDDDDVIDV